MLLHTVKRELLVVTVAEKGTLESAGNKDIPCEVRAGSKGFASTINWVIDDGSRVKAGQLLMILDDSALRDQEDTQKIALVTAKANRLKAKKDVEIAETQNKQNIATAESVYTTAVNDLVNYTGLTYDPARAALAAVAGGAAALAEAGTFRQSVDDLTGQLRLSESQVEQNRERSAWADRMVKLSYMSAAQADAERSRLESSVETARSLRAKRTQLLNSDRDQTLTKLILARDIAELGVDRAKLEAEANLAKFDAELEKCDLLLAQVEAALRDIAQQRAACKIVAPPGIEDGSMVVYFKQESSRFGSSTQGMIEQGAQVKEGQKLLRIPNLSLMRVNTKVHEAMVARVRGDVLEPTHFVDGVQGVMLLNTDPFTRLVGHRHEIVDQLREEFRNSEYKKVSEGQKAMIRVDALPNRTFEGHVRTVAAVASQADSWISDTKLYPTMVMVDYEVLPDGRKRKLDAEQLKPDMTAEVTITVDTAREPVLTVPVQSIVGGTEMGGKREVFIKTATGYERKPVELGLYNEKFVEIKSGVAEGDEVVTNPKVLLGDDPTVKTRDAETKGGGGAKGGNPKGDGTGAPAGKGGGKKKGGGPPAGASGPPG